jgi:hypothetical protein
MATIWTAKNPATTNRANCRRPQQKRQRTQAQTGAGGLRASCCCIGAIICSNSSGLGNLSICAATSQGRVTNVARLSLCAVGNKKPKARASVWLGIVCAPRRFPMQPLELVVQAGANFGTDVFEPRVENCFGGGGGVGCLRWPPAAGPLRSFGS